MDRRSLEYGLVRRLLDHVEQRTTDLADDVLEVPTAAFTSPEHLEREMAALFWRWPLVLCLSGAVPRPGTYLTVDLCGTPVIVTRDHDGQVHSLANVCRHRAVRVADGQGEARLFTCPFHAWSYDLTGRLVGVPSSDCFAGMCHEDKGLVALPVAEGHGLIVGRLRPGPPVDVDELLGAALAEEIDVHGHATWELLGEPHVHQVAANWKVTLDTFRENYHFNHLHRRTLATYAYGGILTFDPFGPHLRNASALRSIDQLRGRPEEEWGDVSGHFSYQYQLFPNTSLTFDARHIDLWQITPVDERRSQVVHSQYLRPDLSEEERAKAVEMAPWICQTVVDGEDFWVAGRTEPGIRTGIVDTVVFGRNEPAPQHLHRRFLQEVAAVADGAPADPVASLAGGPVRP